MEVAAETPLLRRTNDANPPHAGEPAPPSLLGWWIISWTSKKGGHTMSCKKRFAQNFSSADDQLQPKISQNTRAFKRAWVYTCLPKQGNQGQIRQIAAVNGVLGKRHSIAHASCKLSMCAREMGRVIQPSSNMSSNGLSTRKFIGTLLYWWKMCNWFGLYIWLGFKAVRCLTLRDITREQTNSC